jgi:hypothetical protein
MELKDFIKETIRDVSEAIKESNEELSAIGVISNPPHVSSHGASDQLYGFTFSPAQSGAGRPVHLLEFDIAVSTIDKKDGKQGIGVEVAGIKVGKDGRSGEENATNSRLKFGVPVAFPVGQKI